MTCPIPPLTDVLRQTPGCGKLGSVGTARQAVHGRQRQAAAAHYDGHDLALWGW